MVSGWAMVAVLTILLVASLFQSAVGFGASLIAMPVVVQIEPDLVPGSMVLATVALNVLVMIRDRSSVELPALSTAGLGAIGGSAIGLAIVSQVSEKALQVLVALCVLAMVILVATVHATPPRSLRNLLAAGTASGFASTTAGIGGPPIALLFADAEGSRIRGSLATFFVFSAAPTLFALRLAGRFDDGRILAGVALMPAAIVGYLLGRPLTRVVDRGIARPAILTVSGASAVVLLVRSALG